MSSKNKDILKKENAVQAILVADTFSDEFVPISNDIPLALLPVVNKPLIDYTLEFLSLGGIEETFLFCCTHVDDIKSYINKSIKEAVGWSLTMKVNIIVSESCRSFGDCLRDLDAKGLLRGDFVLLEPGVISNVNLLTLLKKHKNITNNDKGAAMTLIYQECGISHISRCPQQEVLLAVNDKNRVVFHKKLGTSKERKVEFPLEIFLDNPSVSLYYNLKDTHIAVCSSSVLPLFSDNFDFQTKDDFVRGLLMNEEILGSTIYCQIFRGSNYGGAITSWRMYQAMSRELNNKWVFPLLPSLKRNRTLKNDVVVGRNTLIPASANLLRVVLGENVKIGNNVTITDSFVLSHTTIEDDVLVNLSIVGPDCVIKSKSKVTAGSVLGKGVVINSDLFVENTLVQSTEPDNCEENDKLGDKAYRLRVDEEDEEDLRMDKILAKKMSRLHISEEFYESDEELDDEFSESEEALSYTYSPAPDDTKLFFTEVIDSLTRGFEDNLLCDNLILEINSSRYAYNVTVKEVNFNVIKAILTLSLRQPIGLQYFSQLSRLLSYFSPVLKNYIRNESAMIDCLQGIEDVATSNEELKEKWVMFVLKYFYDKDYVSEDAILDWFSTVHQESKFHHQVKPFTDWLQEAEEGSSSESDE